MYKLPCVVLSLLIWSLAKPASADLIGWWRLDEGSGVTVADSSEYGHHATLDPPNESAVRWSTAGYAGGALDFTTVFSGYTFVEAPLTPGILTMSHASYAFWMKMPVTHQAWGILFDLVGEATDFSLEPSDTGALFNWVPKT